MNEITRVEWAEFFTDLTYTAGMVIGSLVFFWGLMGR